MTYVTLLLVGFAAPVVGQPLVFIDSAGEVTSSYVEGSDARLRLNDPSVNLDWFAVESAQVDVSSLLTGDLETVTLIETRADSGIFEGSIDLEVNATPSQPGVLETRNEIGPPFQRDTVQADYAGGPTTASVTIEGSATRFVDVYGQLTSEVPVGDRTYVQVIDPDADDPTVFDTAEVTVTALGSGDSEQFFLDETGLATGTFEGSVALGPSASANDGALDAALGESLEVRHPHLNAPDDTFAQATVVGSQTTLVDSAGQPVDEYFEGTTAHVQVIDHGANLDVLNVDTTSGQLSAFLSGDTELISLAETGIDTGVFEASLAIDSSLVVPGNGFLETTQFFGPPVSLDGILATHVDPSGSSSDSVSMVGATLEFLDASGAPASSYPAGGTVYIRVEDHDALDYAVVEILTSGGDNENEFLSISSAGVFEGAVTLQSGTVQSFDSLVQTQIGDQLTVSYTDVFGFSVVTDTATVTASQLEFVEADGIPTTEVLESGTARLRLFSVGDNLNPASIESVTVALSSAFAGDSESLVLTETGADSGIFEGSIGLESSSLGVENGIFETGNSGPPDYTFDTLTASYNAAVATASTVGSRTVFIDAEGRDATSFPVGDRAYVRVTDQNLNDPAVTDIAQVGLVSLTSGDSEVIDLAETGLDTGIFEGSVALGPGSPADDGLLDATFGETIEAMHNHASTPGLSMDQAILSGSQVLFIDANGQLTSEHLHGAPLYLRVIDHPANQNPSFADSTSIEVRSGVTADFETATLVETGPDTGVFEGSLATQLGYGYPNDGVLHTVENFYSADRWDTLTATYSDSFGQSIAITRSFAGRIEFIDGAGQVTPSFATGATAFLRVEDQHLNDPAVLESAMVTVSSSIGDTIDVYLEETDKTAGIYEGSIDLADSFAPDSFNGTLETQAGGDISASYYDGSGGNKATSASITGAQIEFFDDAGLPTLELFENGLARVRVTSHGDNTDPGSIDQVTVTLTSLYAADEEDVVLAETEPDSGLFEATIEMDFVYPPTEIGILANGILETSNSYYGSFLPDQVTATFSGESATATVFSMRLSFVDGFGQDTEVYAAGGQVFVRVINFAWNFDSGLIDQNSALVSALGDIHLEGISLTETDFDSGVFEGSIMLGQSAGLLDAVAGEQIRVEAYANTSTLPHASDLALIVGSETYFVDAAGQLAAEYLQGAPATVRVIDHSANQNPSLVESTSVQLVSEVTGDSESLTLVETGTDSGRFEGSIDTRLGAAILGDGVLDTDENQFAADRRDTLIATYSDAFSQSSATARTVGSQIIFVDAAGQPTTAYATGSTAYLRVVDQNVNDPAILEGVQVSLSSSIGDSLDYFLEETGKTTGIYEGAIDLAAGQTPDSFNGTLETQAGGQVSASYNQAAGSINWASADITATAVEFFDQAGLPTVQLLEDHVARVRVFSYADNFDPGAVDSLTVNLATLYASDGELLLLTETDPDSGIFEGEMTTAFVSPPTMTATPNGVLETSNSYQPAFLAEQVTASFAGGSATVTTVSMLLDFIDGFGQEVEAYAAGDQVYVRVVNHTVNDPGLIDVVDVTVTALATGDSEQVLLSETGFDTAVYEGSIALGSNGSEPDSMLDAAAGEAIEATRAPFTGTGAEGFDAATIFGSETFFIDADGQLTAEYLQGAPVTVRVIDHSANQNPSFVESTSVQLMSEVTGDSELLTLVETEADSGMFEGAIDTRLGIAQVGSGVLDTNENQFAADRRDTLIATYSDAFSQSTAVARTVGSQITFVDAAGQPALSYATGSTAYLRVVDQNVNDPAIFEGVQVSLSSSLGDSLDIFLEETGKTTGIYEGLLYLADATSSDSFNGTLETLPGGQISASYSQAAGSINWASADITATAVEFFDETGLPATQLLEDHVARVRVFSVADNSDPGAVDSLTVSLATLYASDSELLLLIETEADSGIFEGEVTTAFVDPSSTTGTPSNGVLETSNSSQPAFLAEQVTASFGGGSATVTTVSMQLSFIDGFGQEVEAYAAGDQVYVRVINHTVNDPGLLDVVDVTVTALSTGDSEQVLLTETGFDTAIYEGSIALGTGPNEELDAAAGEQIEATRAPFTGTGAAGFDTATIAGSETFFIDEAGQLTAEYLQGAPVYVRVIDHSANQDLSTIEETSVQLASEVTGDSETLTLTETGFDTGVFEGSFATRLGSSQIGNGVLDTNEDPFVADRRDTVIATYSDAFNQSSAVARTVGSRMEFVDAAGQPTASYATGSTAYLRIVDQNVNDPAILEGVQVHLSSSLGDSVDIFLEETGKTTGVYEGTIYLADSTSPDSFNGVLEAQSGGQISASYSQVAGSINWTSAEITGVGVEFFDEAGLPATQLLEDHIARVRVFSVADNTDPVLIDSLAVSLGSLYASDSESLLLTETEADSGIFEGQIPIAFVDPSFTTGTPSNGVLETSNSDQPEFLAEQVTASYGGSSATATTVSMRLNFINLFGQETETYAAGDQITLRVINHTVNDPGLLDVVDVTVTALDSGDVEQVLLTETGLNTAIYEGSIGLGSSGSEPDFLLDAAAGEQIEATRAPFTGTGSAASDSAAVVGSTTFFVDAAGQLTAEYLQASDAFVRVTDHTANQNPSAADTTSVQLTAELTGDSESLTLTETGVDTGVFTGSIDLGVGPGSVGDGLLSTEVSGGAIPYDTVNATYSDAYSESQATASTLGSRIAFIDGFGVEVQVIENGLDAWLRVEDHAANDSALIDSVMATAYASSTGDLVDVYLSETGLDTGVFEGLVTLQDNPVADTFDGLLQTQLGDNVSASHTDAYGSFSSYVDVTVIAPTNLPPSVNIASPADASVFVTADTITFTGTASDPEEGDVSASLVWTSDLDGVIGTGAAVTANLSIGSHYVIASVIDAGGRSGEASIVLQVDNTPPVPTITSPVEGTHYGAAVAVEFAGSATDYDDGDLTASIQWFSDRDGALGSGGSIFRILTEGDHLITAMVNDSGGLTGYASVNITIDPANTEPSVTISTPASGSSFVTADAIAFAGVASDIEDGDLGASLSWTSDLDGVIGSGATFSANLSQGAHVITASVTDSGGLSGSYTVNIQIDNSAPSASITAPINGSMVNAGVDVTFTGSATDYDDGDLTANLSWTSDLDGAIGTGGSFTTSSLSSGTHVITASVTDAGGLSSSDTITVTVNAGPSASITSPADGTGFNAGDSVSFVGTASDSEDGDLTSSLSWTSDLDGAIGTGGSFTMSSLSSGTHVITASVTDAGGLSSSDTITLTVNGGPSASITSPVDGSSVNTGASVSFVGTASDTEDGDLTSSLSWTSSLDGAIGNGGSFTTSSLSSGTHVITASVTDVGGLSSSDTITLTVNGGPSASITSPADGSSVNVGASVSFVGTASDTEDGDLTSSLSWTSDLDGAIGTGGSFTTSSLSSGTHVITASVTDAGGLSSSDTITLTVNAAPSASITSPSDGSTFDQGDAISFVGSAIDLEDGDLTAGLTWSSDLDGVIGSGGGFSTSTLSLGPHTITASVTDSGGLTAVAAISLTVKLPPVQVTLTSIGSEDGWVRESSENSDVGGSRNNTGSGASALRPGDHKKDSQYKAIVSFDTSSIPAGATILSADLRLQRGKLTGTNPFTTHGTCWVDIQSGSFSGSTAVETSDFQAAATATQVASLSNPPSNGDWSEGSLNAAGLAAVNAGGRTQLRIYFDLDDNDDSGNDYMGYYSGDNSNSSRHPQLVITYQP